MSVFSINPQLNAATIAFILVLSGNLEGLLCLWLKHSRPLLLQLGTY